MVRFYHLLFILGDRFSLSTSMESFIRDHPRLNQLFRFFSPSSLLFVYHFYAVSVFLSQFFVITNLNHLLNTVPCDHIVTENEWLQLIHEFCPQINDLVKKNKGMKNFYQLFHSYYDSVPVDIEKYYKGDLSLLRITENV